MCGQEETNECNLFRLSKGSTLTAIFKSHCGIWVLKGWLFEVKVNEDTHFLAAIATKYGWLVTFNLYSDF